jgi:hypothetical protein
VNPGDPATRRLIADLHTALARSGYREFLTAHSDDVPDPGRWARAARETSGPLRHLVGLFLLGEEHPLAALPPEVAAAVPLFVAHGAASVDGDRVHLIDVALFRPRGVWLLAEPPSFADTTHYFGADSVELAARVDATNAESCLDLCAGTGFQGLAAGSACRRTTMVELRAPVARLAELNVLLNDRHAEVLCGDLYEALPPDSRYDLVVANVPFLPDPRGGPSGPDGFGLGRRVLDGLPTVLSANGTAHLTALFLQTGDTLTIEPELRDRATSYAITVEITDPLSLDADSDLVQSIVWAGDPPPTAAEAEHLTTTLLATFARAEATVAHLAYLTVHASRSGLRFAHRQGTTSS